MIGDSSGLVSALFGAVYLNTSGVIGGNLTLDQTLGALQTQETMVNFFGKINV